MPTEYKHNITLAVPESKITKANKLAAIFGLNAADINTFKTADYEDTNQNKFAVTEFKCRDSFLNDLQNTSLPKELPTHTQELYSNKSKFKSDAKAALDAVHSGEIKKVVDKPLSQALSDLGLSRIEPELEEVS
jgi:hypothetical protein